MPPPDVPGYPFRLILEPEERANRPQLHETLKPLMQSGRVRQGPRHPDLPPGTVYVMVDAEAWELVKAAGVACGFLVWE